MDEARFGHEVGERDDREVAAARRSRLLYAYAADAKHARKEGGASTRAQGRHPCRSVSSGHRGPPIAQERVTRGPDGLVRIALKKAFSDGTIAIDLDALSLLTRLCAAVPPRASRVSTTWWEDAIGRGPSS